ncbi:hypothetical protein [Ligilactobacillus equi]|uniref:Uncharacterized protein n=2 Tax=Ligilactobacillus equi TaxID=137357 RepID=V7HWE2_9LACO|nr:hypothetical protein [Ligilactobacillus equi]ETA74569.1 hypothetical protein LEQ_0434c [Ligilactobacillus equi DPC 6820]KRL84352.1 hypothetical protein FC36_GL000275 [Ligilactobacillus equi DSM 15833 = JCM 10991]
MELLKKLRKRKRELRFDKIVVKYVRFDVAKKKPYLTEEYTLDSHYDIKSVDFK